MTINPLILTTFEITGAPQLDPIRVILQDLGTGSGRIIIECYGKAWSAYWGSMGDKDLRSFLLTTSADYIEGCLHQGQSPKERDREYLQRIAQAVKDALKAAEEAATAFGADNSQPRALTPSERLLAAFDASARGFAPLDRRARECTQMLEAIGCDSMGHGNTLVGMTYAACREIVRLRQLTT